MVDNLDIYNQTRKVPAEAKKKIKGGRLSGMTDISPMWRIKKLTDIFGPCGFGWKYEIVEKRLETGGNNEIAAFVDINLYYKKDGKWSEAIPGTGGSTFVAKESKGLHTSDECFKMALTDAISVACKALGMGADVYWDKDKTKYTQPPVDKKKPTVNKNHIETIRALYKTDPEKVKPVIMPYLEDKGYKNIADVAKLSGKESAELLHQIKQRLAGK